MTAGSPLFQDTEGIAVEPDPAGSMCVTRQVLPRRLRTSLSPAEPSRAGHRVDLETLQRVRAGLDRL
ncbi:MAG: hypothetical protein ACRDOU_25285 [Streptosporangiaceae bacterium]